MVVVGGRERKKQRNEESIRTLRKAENESKQHFSK